METAIKICAVSLLCGMAIAPAMAEEFYAALSAGQAAAINTCTGVADCHDSGISMSGAYRFTPMSGTEIGYATFGKASLGGSDGDREHNDIEASADGTPRYGHILSSRESRFGLFRIQHKITVPSATSAVTDLAYGIAAQYDLSHGLALRAQYERLRTLDDVDTTGQAKTTLLSVGAVYRF